MVSFPIESSTSSGCGIIATRDALKTLIRRGEHHQYGGARGSCRVILWSLAHRIRNRASERGCRISPGSSPHSTNGSGMFGEWRTKGERQKSVEGEGRDLGGYNVLSDVIAPELRDLHGRRHEHISFDGARQRGGRRGQGEECGSGNGGRDFVSLLNSDEERLAPKWW